MLALSFSRLKDAGCPFRFHTLYIQKSYKEPETEPMKIGGEVALFLQCYRTHCCRAGLERDESYFDHLYESWEKEGKWTDVEKAYQLLSRFFTSDFGPFPCTSPIIMIEDKLAFDKDLNLIQGDDAWFSKQAAFRVIGDFAYCDGDTLRIIDDKTGYADPDPLQLQISACLIPRAIRARTPGLLDGVRFVAPTFNVLSGGHAKRIDLEILDIAKSDELASKILARVDEVNNWNEYPAVACDRCAHCTVPGCPIDAGVRKDLVSTGATAQPPILQIPTAITNREMAEKAVQFLVFADRISSEVREILTAYVEQNGPVATIGKVAELRAFNPWHPKDLKSLVNALLAYGAKPEFLWESLNLSETDLESICRKSGIKNRLPLLFAMGERKEYKPRFGIYKDKLTAS